MSGKKLIIMRGCPGSGKSTYASWLNGLICSADDYFMKDGRYCFDLTLLGEAHAQCQEKCRRGMQEGVALIVIDNTNLMAEDFEDYQWMAGRFGYEVEFAEPKCMEWEVAKELASSLKRLAAAFAARSVHGVPAETIARMILKYEPLGQPATKEPS